MKTLQEGLAEFNQAMSDTHQHVPATGGNLSGVAIHIWKPIWVEDMSEQPIYVESKAQYRRELKARGLDCPGLH